ncbi:MAG: hypothetical protein U0S48_11615 [Solirubrobacteraceae bacterium]
MSAHLHQHLEIVAGIVREPLELAGRVLRPTRRVISASASSADEPV